MHHNRRLEAPSLNIIKKEVEIDLTLANQAKGPKMEAKRPPHALTPFENSRDFDVGKDKEGRTNAMSPLIKGGGMSQGSMKSMNSQKLSQISSQRS